MKKPVLALLALLILVMAALPGTALADDPWIWIGNNSTYTDPSHFGCIFKIGDSAELSVDAIDFTPTEYQWYSNTVFDETTASPIAGATGQTYSPSTASEGTTFYFCIAKDADLNEYSSCAVVAVMADPPRATITREPLPQTVAVGNTATFTMDATIIPADAGATFQWWRATSLDSFFFEEIPGANSKSYTTSPVTRANNGYEYYCAVEYAYDGRSYSLADTGVVELTVIDAPESAEEIPTTGDSPLIYICAGTAVAAIGFAAFMRRRGRKQTEA